MSAGPGSPRAFSAAIFDVDGVLVASPHERAWREALRGITDPARLTTEFYQAHVAGRPRLSGAMEALLHLGIADAAERVAEYAARKQQILEDLVAAGEFTVFADALRLLHALALGGIRLAVASSSKNANQLMGLIRVPDDRTLLDLFDANVCGRDFAHGKPAPDIFLAAAADLGVAPAVCVVVEDAAAGIAAARAAGMAGLGVARLDDAALLQATHADLVVSSLDDVDVNALINGRLAARGG